MEIDMVWVNKMGFKEECLEIGKATVGDDDYWKNLREWGPEQEWKEPPPQQKGTRESIGLTW